MKKTILGLMLLLLSAVTVTAVMAADFWASEVISAQQGSGDIEVNRSDPTSALGPSDHDGTSDFGVFYSLGGGGSIVLKLAEPVDGSIEVYEATWGPCITSNMPEEASVFVSENGVDWIDIGTATNNSPTCIDQTYITTLDLNGQCIQYVKVVDDNTHTIGDGFDLDAVGGTGGCAPGIVNEPPVADAGFDQVIECICAGNVVTLDGSGSFDPDGDPLTYTWTGGFIGGEITGVSPTVVFPGVGDYVITLTVEDPLGESDTGEVLVTVEDTTVPEITAELVMLSDSGNEPRYQARYTASDACDGDLEVTATLDVEGSDEAVLVVTARDASGNTTVEEVRPEVDDDSEFEGLTPGYWKNHLEDWEDYSPDQTVQDVFDVPDEFGLDSDTLLMALDYGGGDDLTGKAQILLRASVAAVLNAAHTGISYPISSRLEVIDQVNAALASEDETVMTELANVLDGYNNLGVDDM